MWILLLSLLGENYFLIDTNVSFETAKLAIQLRALIKQLHDSLRTLEPKLNNRPSGVQLLQLPVELPRSPIFSLLTPHPRSLAKYCQDGGFVVRAIVPPTVPDGGERVRICLHAGNKGAEIEGLVVRIGEWLELLRKSERGQDRKPELGNSRL